MKHQFFFALFSIILLLGCAKMGSPTGGPKDVHPPEYILGEPANRSVGFKEDRIDIYFDEYLQLRDQNKEIIISPPMDKKPVVRVREKSIRVTFNEDLLPNTTYTINFGRAIADLNEGNALPDFEFVFSTGNVIDSLSVTGKIQDAFTLKPETEKDVFILLYENLADSAPYNEIPRYYGKANDFGLFAVNNIHPDTFRIIALKDANNNLRYDQGLEDIAFTDSLLVINSENVTVQTFIKDTLKIITPARIVPRGNKKDTANVADTVIAPGKVLNALNVTLYSFLEENNRVFITSRSRESSEQFTFTFNRSLFEPLRISPVNFEPGDDWYLTEPSTSGDTLSYWITDTLIAKKDTLQLQLQYSTTDSSGLLVTITDTVKLRLSPASLREERGAGGGGRRARVELKKDSKNTLQIIPGIRNGGTMNLNAALVLTTNKPVRSLNAENVELSKLVDTLFVPEKFQEFMDSGQHRKFSIKGNWEESTEYKVLLKPGSVTDIYGYSHDSIETRFITQREDYYGRVLLNFSAYAYPMIIQIIDQKGSVIRTAIARNAGIITFSYMTPGTYRFKAIFDQNDNGKWDIGNYLKHIQPEKVFISEKAEPLRSNWDWEPAWNIPEN
jgi:hypothetical protein